MAARRSRWSTVALFGAGMLAGASLTCSTPPASRAPATSPATVVGGLLMASPAFAHTPQGGPTLADIAAQAVPGVVNISATRRVEEPSRANPMLEDPMLREFFGPRGPWEVPRDRQTRSLGSGVIVTADGIVMTSAHVVDGADQVDITLSDGREVDGVVVGSDPQSDLAVVRILQPTADLKPVALGDSATTRLGDVVLAIGNPFGVGQTVTMGIVSATGRSRVGIVDYEDFIQTDAAINPGNSGGALINMRGELVGVNTAILSRSGGYQGIGFAIPTSMAEPIMRSLVERGRVVRGWLGIVIQEIDRDLAAALDLEAHSGIVVSDVAASGPGSRAGLARGDIIRQLDGSPVTSSAWFRNRVASLAPGSEVSLTLVRQGEERVVKVKLGRLERGQEGARGEAPRSKGPATPNLLSGVRVVDLDTARRRKLDVPRATRGAVVTAVAPGSSAERMGLAANDVVIELDGRRVASALDFQHKARIAGRAVALLVFRGGSTLYLAARR